MAAKKRIYFQLDAPAAKEVEVRGSFNGWETRDLKKNKKGVWKTWTTVKPGTYEYRFLVDGEWMNDPAATKIPNEFGSENSVQTVG